MVKQQKRVGISPFLETPTLFLPESYVSSLNPRPALAYLNNT